MTEKVKFDIKTVGTVIGIAVACMAGMRSYHKNEAATQRNYELSVSAHKEIRRLEEKMYTLSHKVSKLEAKAGI